MTCLCHGFLERNDEVVPWCDEHSIRNPAFVRRIIRTHTTVDGLVRDQNQSHHPGLTRISLVLPIRSAKKPEYACCLGAQDVYPCARLEDGTRCSSRAHAGSDCTYGQNREL